MKLYFYIIIFSFLHHLVIGQSLSMKLKMNENETEYPIIIEADIQQIYKLKEKGFPIKIGAQIDNKMTIYTSPQTISYLYKQSWVKKISDGKIKMIPLLDSSRIFNNFDSVHQGFSPLVTSYQGQNVVMGIIDMGIEWRHRDFKNSDSTSRIKFLWDQNVNSNFPTGYSYGTEWTDSSINAHLCTHNSSSTNGHGTNVAGIAAGNGTINPNYKGVAPKSTLVVVSLKNDNSWYTQLIDGISYIFNKADQLNLPCVINISIGTYDGSHDGKDAGTRMIEAMVEAKKGRVIVAASGNSGHLSQHIRMIPNNDTLFTDFKNTPAYGGTYFNFWADTQNITNLTIGIQADSSPTLLPLSKSYFLNIKSQFLDSTLSRGYKEDTVYIKNQVDSLVGTAYLYSWLQESAFNFQCYIVPKNTQHLWRFMATGTGKLDMWVNNSLAGTSDIYTSPLPSSTINPSIINYKLSDQDYSIVSEFQCSNKIITVGNYVNKYGITDIDTIYRPIGGKVGEIASSSSKGPTRDDRLKPDITASGGQTITTIDSINRSIYLANAGLRKKLSTEGQYVVAGGTSMSSPVVAGACTLLLEKAPTLKSSQILYLIKKTAKKDSFTTPNANNTYGHGKLDIFGLIKYPFRYGCLDTGSINYDTTIDFEDSTLCIKKVYGCTDTGSINYNPLANVDNGTCIKKVYGCTDTGSINYNPLANIDNGTCVKKVYGCTDTGSINYNPLANVDNGTCIKKIYGCTDTGSINYNPLANVDNGTCIKKIYGCTDSKAINYNPKANIDDHSCQYSVSIRQPIPSELVIYPNPSTDVFKLDVNDFKTHKIQLFDINGTLIFESILYRTLKIDLTGYPKGIYFLKVNDINNETNFKLFLK